MKPLLGLLAAIAIIPAAEANSQMAAVELTPHRAVYDLSLLTSDSSRGLDAASGRIAYDFSGDACEGYALSFRQVSVLESSEGDPRTSDQRTTTFEDGDGGTFKFRSETQLGPIPARVVDGHADHGKSGVLTIEVAKPRPDRVKLDEAVLFPSAHMRKLIEAARAGETTLSAKVFDGSDDGQKIYDTLSIIGRTVEPGHPEGLEEPALKAGLDKMKRWPVTISYFTAGDGERTPIYKLSFALFENGVSGALRLDYGDFALKGELKTLDIKTASACKR